MYRRKMDSLDKAYKIKMLQKMLPEHLNKLFENIELEIKDKTPNKIDMKELVDLVKFSLDSRYELETKQKLEFINTVWNRLSMHLLTGDYFPLSGYMEFYQASFLAAIEFNNPSLLKNMWSRIKPDATTVGKTIESCEAKGSKACILAIWEKLSEKHEGSIELTKAFFKENRLNFDRFYNVGLLTAIQNSDTDVLEFLLKNMRDVSGANPEVTIQLLQACLSAESADVIKQVLETLQRSALSEAAKSLGVLKAIDSILGKSPPTINLDIPASPRFNEILKESIDGQLPEVGTWLINVVFVASVMNRMNGQINATPEFLLGLAEAKGIRLDKSIFIKLYEKIQQVPQPNEMSKWFLELSSNYLKAPLYTLEEAIAAGDLNFTLELVALGTMRKPEKENETLLRMLVSSNKFSSDHIKHILKKMFDNGLTLDPPTFTFLMNIATQRKKHPILDASIFDFLLSKGTVDTVLYALANSPETQIDLRLFAQLENDADIRSAKLEGYQVAPVVNHLKTLFTMLADRSPEIVPYLKQEKTQQFKCLLETHQKIEKMILEYKDTANSGLKSLENYKEEQERNEREKKLQRERATPYNNPYYRTTETYAPSSPYRDWYAEYSRYIVEQKKLKRNACAKAMIDLVNQNQQGRVLLPCGWPGTSDTHGHAMQLCLEKMPEGKYRIIILNTGSGLEYHNKKTVGNKEKYCPARVFEGLDREEVAHLLEEIVIRPSTDSTVFQIAQDTFTKEFIYGVLQKENLVFHEVSSSNFSYITPQRSGTCTAKIFSPIEQYVFGEDFSAYKYYIKDFTNRYYLEQMRFKDASGKKLTLEEIVQLDYSLQNFARLLTKLEHAQKLPIEEVKLGFKQLLENRALLEKWRTEYDEKRIADRKGNVVLAIPKTDSLSPVSFTAGNIEAVQKDTQHECLQRNVIPLEFCSVEDLTPETFNVIFKRLTEYQENNLFQESNIVIMDFLNKALKKVTNGTIKIEPQESIGVLENINKMIDFYNNAIYRCDGQEISSTNSLVHMIALLIEYKVLEASEKKSDKQYSLLQSFNVKKKVKQFDKVFNKVIGSNYFTLYHPVLCSSLENIKLTLPVLGEIKKVTEYNYLSQNYIHLAKVMDALSEEEFKRREEDWELIEKSRAEQKAQEAAKGNWNYYVPPTPPRPRPLEDMEKYRLISHFLNDKKGFVEKLSSLAEKIDQQRISVILQEFELLQNDNFNMELLDRMTTEVETMSRNIGFHNSKVVAPFEYRHVSYNSKVVKNVLERSREKNANHLQVLLGKLRGTGFTEKEVSTMQRVMSARVTIKNQIFSIIEFFKNNAGLLMNVENQVLLHCFLFEPGVLQNEWGHNERLTSHLLDFLTTGIRKYRDTTSLLPAGAFLYELASLISEFHPSYDNKEQKEGHEIEALMRHLPYELSIFQPIEKAGLLTEDQVLTYGRLCKVQVLAKLKCLNGGEPFNEAEFKELFFGFIKARQLNLRIPLLNESTKALESKISEMMAFCRVALENAFKDERLRDEILEHIAATHIPPIHLKNNFSGVFPIYRAIDTEGKSIEVNLETGKCLQEKLEAGYMPMHVRGKPFFTTRFGNVNPRVLIYSSEDRFEFEHQERTYLLVTTNPNIFKLYVKISGVWCIERTRYGRSLPTSILERYNIFDSEQESFFEPKNRNDVYGLNSQTPVSIFNILRDSNRCEMKMLRFKSASTKDSVNTIIEKIKNATSTWNYVPFIFKIADDPKTWICDHNERGEIIAMDITELNDELMTEYHQYEIIDIELSEQGAHRVDEVLLFRGMRKSQYFSIDPSILKNISEKNAHDFHYVNPLSEIQKRQTSSSFSSDFRPDLLKVNNDFWNITYETFGIFPRPKNCYKLSDTETKDLLELDWSEGLNSRDLLSLPESIRSKIKLRAEPGNLFLTEKGKRTDFRLRDTSLGARARWDDISRRLFENMTAFIDPEYIEFYDNIASQDAPPLQVKLPSYHLHLVSKKYPEGPTGVWHLFLKDKPNYRLNLDVPKPMLIKNFPHWLSFEDISTDPKET